MEQAWVLQWVLVLEHELVVAMVRVLVLAWGVVWAWASERV